MSDIIPEPKSRPSTLPRLIAWGVGVLVVLLAGGLVLADWWSTLPEDVDPSFVGRNQCVECHQQEHQLWEGSHHDLAMDLATEESVLGDFNDATIEHFGIESKMFRRDEKYWVNTEGPDGQMQDFEVKYVFGVEPLQQYMVELKRPEGMAADEISKVQVLRISWDTENEKWFYLSPPDVDEKLAPDDDLHWTGITQCWNTTCAECHSTNLEKKFDVDTQTYHTTYSEIDVSCEACHGPGSVHVELATANSLFWDRKLGYGLATLKGKDSKPQLETCAKCHSRRRTVKEGFQPGEPYHDFYGTDALVEPLYHCDGQILDEVYVFGSFLQSKMYHKGIRCTDCHDPHSTKIKFPDNKLCTSCHAHPAGKFDVTGHHNHKTGGTGASCVECHMPETTYMAVDPRRDHSLRVPRPDLSVKYGTPNACTGCHLDRSKLPASETVHFKQYADWILAANAGNKAVSDDLKAIDQWALDSVIKWYGEKVSNSPHFADTFFRARRNDVDSKSALIELADARETPDLVRATAIIELGRFADSETKRHALDWLDHADPQVRIAAIGHLETVWRAVPTYSGQDMANNIAPLLTDESRLVRIEAGRVLANLPDDPSRIPQEQAEKLMARLSGTKRQARNEAIEEFADSLMTSNDRGAAHMGLGILYESMRDFDRAEAAYQAAMKVEPGVTGPRGNLAHLLETRIAEIQRNIQANRNPNYAAAEFPKIERYTQRVEQLRGGELKLLERDAQLAPNLAPVQYRFGLAVYLAGDLERAESALVKAAELEPSETQYLLAVALLYQKLKRYNEAIIYCNEALKVRPGDDQILAVFSPIQQEKQLQNRP